LKKNPCVVVPADDETRPKKLTTSTPPMHINKATTLKRTTGSFKNTTDIMKTKAQFELNNTWLSEAGIRGIEMNHTKLIV
jgi:hypothetical protein